MKEQKSWEHASDIYWGLNNKMKDWEVAMKMYDKLSQVLIKLHVYHPEVLDDIVEKCFVEEKDAQPVS